MKDKDTLLLEQLYDKVSNRDEVTSKLQEILNNIKVEDDEIGHLLTRDPDVKAHSDPKFPRYLQQTMEDYGITEEELTGYLNNPKYSQLASQLEEMVYAVAHARVIESYMD